MVGKNNPFNIRVSTGNNWLGQIGSTRGFVDFSSMDYGIRAACVLIMQSYRRKNVLTISDIIHRFAPPIENNTQKYIDFVCSLVGSFPFDVPKRDDFPRLLSAMSKYEGNPVLVADVRSVILKFNIKSYKCKY